MEKRMFSLTPEQVAWVRKEAERLGIGMSELVRRIIDKSRKV